LANKTNIGVLIGFSLSGIILLYLLSQLEWPLFLQELGRVDWRYLPLIAVLFLFSFWIRAARWRYLLPSGLEVSTLKLFNACILGMLATCVLPLRAGEFVRPWVLSRGKKVSFSLAFSSVVTERVFDVLAMLTLFICTLSTIENPPAWAPNCAKSLATLAGAILLVMITAYFRADWVLAFSRRCIDLTVARFSPAGAEKLQGIAAEFIQGLKSISSFGELLMVLILSFVLWLEFSGVYYIGLLIFGLTPDWWQAHALNVFVALAVAVPSAPGFLGTFQIGCLAALHQIYHYSKELALAYSVVMHSMQIILSVVAGFVMLQYEGLSFRQLKVREETAATDAILESSLK
jgi:uncharacterized protein (TIRG00374 family)